MTAYKMFFAWGCFSIFFPPAQRARSQRFQPSPMMAAMVTSIATTIATAAG
jgi:hypothetical protein